VGQDAADSTQSWRPFADHDLWSFHAGPLRSRVRRARDCSASGKPFPTSGGHTRRLPRGQRIVFRIRFSQAARRPGVNTSFSFFFAVLIGDQPLKSVTITRRPLGNVFRSLSHKRTVPESHSCAPLQWLFAAAFMKAPAQSLPCPAPRPGGHHNACRKRLAPLHKGTS